MIFSSLSISDVPVVVLRDDLNHPIVSGNKLHKLSPNIKYAKANYCDAILSFGGPFSNHLHALAWASKEVGLSSIGIVRGELHKELTPTLQDCQSWGMKLIACPRQEYRQYQATLSSLPEPYMANEVQLNSYISKLKNTLIIPEGGSNVTAIDSLKQAYQTALNSQQCRDISHVICATGTGATVAGLILSAPKHVEVIGVQAVAEGDATLKRIKAWGVNIKQNVRIEPGHLGGFGKIPKELIKFISDFEAHHNIPLDPIYNGKAMLKLSQLIAEQRLGPNSKVLFIHTGGLQGKRSKSA